MTAKPDLLTVREMREADTVDVHHIHTACLTTSLAADYSREALEAWMHGRSPEGYWRFANSGETFRVAELDGEIVGFANWSGDELRSLFIAPSHQRSGTGSTLFDACQQEAKLTFVKATLGAVGFYKRFSFTEVGRGFDLKRGVQLPHVAMRRQIA
ncbi:GNAT family N-acetyltransferase [Sphingomonas sp.]|jgi:GNAT superfamily N-acetyltransferase|uniref:GNAT family N-acetyltransferase n=1 Tax=Sphingomonas sp. TaxID=28214 RepID=UPI002D80BA2E|nr:GNAT family N-acetyltransferase [Sphingomonas sp.]HEU0045470.1 GNAT family N-acetyltransferase [Sphingomonas sp.]